MPRIARNSFETSFFHVITQGVNREYIFSKQEYIENYLHLLNKYKEEYNVSILAYCIMNNHAHLLIYTPHVNNMGKFMHIVDGIYGQYYNKKESRVGIVFRNRYVSEPIYNERYLAKCINYIHMNPVKAGIVNKSEKYQYSSSRDYKNNTGIAKNPILLQAFGKDFSSWLNEYDIEGAFEDVDVSREELIEEGIKRFEKIKNKELKEILENRANKKEIVNYLKNEYKIKYVEMMQRLHITQGEMNRLKNDNFQTRP